MVVLHVLCGKDLGYVSDVQGTYIETDGYIAYGSMNYLVFYVGMKTDVSMPFVGFVNVYFTTSVKEF